MLLIGYDFFFSKWLDSRAFPRCSCFFVVVRKTSLDTENLDQEERTARPSGHNNDSILHDWCSECCATCREAHGGMGIHGMTREHATEHV